ncbi:hypothetical protein [Magnetococcus marinus]|uniref:hypothetical protein n=1 Tax=Magnetococcus marinus TaxID=1124597 RepID=UPI00030377F3|nr:hypothetical protein [Magnetococcus marinus]
MHAQHTNRTHPHHHGIVQISGGASDRNPGFAPPTQRPTEKTPKACQIETMGPHLLDLAVSNLAGLERRAGDHQAGHSDQVAQERFQAVLAVSVQKETARQTKGPSDDTKTDQTNEPRKSTLGSTTHARRVTEMGYDVGETSVSKYMVKPDNPPSQSWRTFLDNHANQIIAMDFFTVPTIFFKVLHILILIDDDRRRIIHFNVTTSNISLGHSTNPRSVSLGSSSALSSARSRPALHGQSALTQINGNQNCGHCPRIPQAKCHSRTDDWQLPQRVF